MVMRVAVVGVGPRGLNVVERVLARSRATGAAVELELFEPRPRLGTGVHDPDQPEYLLLNTVCAQLTTFADEAMVGPGAPTTPGPDLFTWARVRGLPGGEPRAPRAVLPSDHLPRAVLGA